MIGPIGRSTGASARAHRSTGDMVPAEPPRLLVLADPLLDTKCPRIPELLRVVRGHDTYIHSLRLLAEGTCTTLHHIMPVHIPTSSTKQL